MITETSSFPKKNLPRDRPPAPIELNGERPLKSIACLDDTQITAARRSNLSTAVIENGQAKIYEITSLTTNKKQQLEKEINIRHEGGAFIRDRETKKLVPVIGLSQTVRLP